jgi:dephospho-CoA kinase
MTTSAQRKPVIGLLGGIGSGKSQASAAFARRGAVVVNADGLAHEALRQPDVREQIVARWGKELLDESGQVQRRKLGAIVFADPEERKALELLVHPWIKALIKEEVEKAQEDPRVPFVVLDAAIMLEAGWSGVCDRLVFVDAPRELRLRRVAEQRGWSAPEVEARESAQLTLTEKRLRADHVLDNSASLAHLQQQVDELLPLWGLTGMAPASHGPPEPTAQARTAAGAPDR